RASTKGSGLRRRRLAHASLAPDIDASARQRSHCDVVPSQRYGSELVQPQGSAAGRSAGLLFDLFARASDRQRRCGRGAHVSAGSRAWRGQRAAAGSPRPGRGTGRQCDARWSQQADGGNVGNGAGRRCLDVCRGRSGGSAQGCAQYRLGNRASQGERHLALCRTYMVSLAAVLSLGFLLLVSLLLTTALAVGGKYIAAYVPELAMHALGSVVSFGMITLLFAMMFKWLPDTDVAWRDVWLGATITAALFEIGKLLIGLY